MDRVEANAVHTDGNGIVLVVDDDRRLVGVITDGDIRRGLLSGLSLEDPVSKAMSPNPTCATPEMSRHQLLRLFDRRVRHVPIVDRNGCVIDLLLYSQFGFATKSDQVVIRAKAPLRASFAGGGSDFTKHIEQGGGGAISASVNHYCYGSLIKRHDARMHIYSYDYKTSVQADTWEELRYDGNLDLPKAVIKLLKPEVGFDLYTESDVLPGTGMGSSGSMAVVVAGLLNELRHERLDDYEIAEAAYQAERLELGVSGGWQDQYAAVFGGFNYIEFTKEDVLVHPLRLSDHVIYELENNLVLMFTGVTRNSGMAQRRQESAASPQTFQARQRSCELALEIKNALLKGNLDLFAKLLDESWAIKKQFGPHVSNGLIDTFHRIAFEHGAIAGKLLGAGEGGYLLFYCLPTRRRAVQDALEQHGGKVVDFNFDFRGLHTWRASVRESTGQESCRP